jgi:hypothetical protein
MLKTNSFLSANERKLGPRTGIKQPLCVFEPRDRGATGEKGRAKGKRCYLEGTNSRSYLK